MIRRFLCCPILLIAAVSAVANDTTPVLERAHAHNDYHHTRPLLDALEHGFCSVEADVFLVRGKLLVGHAWIELRPSRTLRSLYLDPLRERARKGDGRIYPGGPSLTLLADIKTDATDTFAALDRLLAEYDDIVTTVRDGKLTERAVTVVVSGNRDRQAIATAEPRRAAIDGRLGDLQSDAPAHLIPLISDRWSSHFSYNGVGQMSPEERAKLRRIVAQTHQSGRRLRFWATPDTEAMWAELRNADVDLINTDNLPGLRRFLTESRGRVVDSEMDEATD